MMYCTQCLCFTILYSSAEELDSFCCFAQAEKSFVWVESAGRYAVMKSVVANAIAIITNVMLSFCSQRKSFFFQSLKHSEVVEFEPKKTFASGRSQMHKKQLP